ncbi:MAG TPA: extradiol ring-cleavage dioxygenase [Candidatus Limnocylindria bacterium]|nr:extradiol ring-cleavage dioxygenase [Candidatus Limnocylindria bacterium]
MPLVFAAIAPHGGIAIAEACTPEQLQLAAVTRRGMEELGRRSARATPDVAIVLTPHNIHVEGAMAVITSGTIAGALEGHPSVALRIAVDRDLALAVRDAIAADGIPVAGVSYGANDAAAASFPMDWAVLVPLWFMGGRADPPVRTVVIAPARDLSYDRHVAAGRAVAKAVASSSRRVALIASCDHGHGHDAKGPYGFTPKSKEFDDRVVDLVKRDDLGALLKMDPRLPVEGKADSYWQMLMLHGALEPGRWRGEFLSYEAPTYFGMLCAAYEPRA